MCTQATSLEGPALSSEDAYPSADAESVEQGLITALDKVLAW